MLQNYLKILKKYFLGIAGIDVVMTLNQPNNNVTPVTEGLQNRLKYGEILRP